MKTKKLVLLILSIAGLVGLALSLILNFWSVSIETFIGSAEGGCSIFDCSEDTLATLTIVAVIASLMCSFAIMCGKLYEIFQNKKKKTNLSSFQKIMGIVTFILTVAGAIFAIVFTSNVIGVSEIASAGVGLALGFYIFIAGGILSAVAGLFTPKK